MWSGAHTCSVWSVDVDVADSAEVESEDCPGETFFEVWYSSIVVWSWTDVWVVGAVCAAVGLVVTVSHFCFGAMSVADGSECKDDRVTSCEFTEDVGDRTVCVVGSSVTSVGVEI